MRNVTERLFIVSTYQNDVNTDTNYSNLLKELGSLKELGFNPVITSGKFMGKEEKALAFYGDNNAEKIVEKITEKYNQTSYLVVYFDKVAEFVSKGVRNMAGYWAQIEGKPEGDYTELQNKFYVIK